MRGTSTVPKRTRSSSLQTARQSTHHLHLTVPGSDLWRERLAFRDALRADPALAEEYAAWKVAHANGTSARDGYTGNKRPLVLRVLEARGIDLKPDEERLSQQRQLSQ